MHKIYPRLFNKLFLQPVMLADHARIPFERALLQAMGYLPSAHVAPAPQPHQVDTSTLHWRTQRVFQQVGSIAIVTIDGVIDKCVDSFELSCYGGCDLADVDNALALCRDDAGITQVILAINSPGGSVTGTPETAARVAALDRVKPVTAWAPVDCCSAAYYIASQSRRIVAAPSARIGSIGTIRAVLDMSEALKEAGLNLQVIKGGKFKDMGAQWRPLTDEEVSILQTEIDELTTRFREAVTSNRPRVSMDSMQGQCFDGIKAEDLWLVDELSAETLDEFVSRLLLS